MGRQRAHPGGAVQRRTSGRTRAQPRRRAGGDGRRTEGRPTAKRLAENEAELLSAYREIAEAVDAGAVITPAAEWLIDNFHLIEKQIREIRADLPVGYYRQLPKLASGPFVGYPRVFGATWALVAHTDSLFDPEILRRYLRAYQEVQPLTIGELWAVAITLRIVLVENLRRIAKRIVDSGAGRRAADALADRLLGAGSRAPEPSNAVLPQHAETTYPDAFLVHLAYRLRDQDPSIAPALEWLDQQLARQGTTADAIIHDEHQRQVTSSVTVRNIITSMRLISDVDWTELFERVSLVDEVFKGGKPICRDGFPNAESLPHRCRTARPRLRLHRIGGGRSGCSGGAARVPGER